MTAFFCGMLHLHGALALALYLLGIFAVRGYFVFFIYEQSTARKYAPEQQQM